MGDMRIMTLYKQLSREFGAQGWWPTIEKSQISNPKFDGYDHGFEIMVGAILTQNTAWSNVEKAIRNLIHAHAMGPEKIITMSSETVERLIRPAGYFRQKTKKLKIFSAWYVRRRGALGRIKTAELRKELLELWGIGPETADSILLYALGRPVFVVDAYTRRLCASKALRGMNPRATYEALQESFMGALPRSVKLYNEFHALIVRWGKLNGRRAS